MSNKILEGLKGKEVKSKTNRKSIEDLWAAGPGMPPGGGEHQPHTQPRLKRRSDPGVWAGKGIVRCLPRDQGPGQPQEGCIRLS